MNKIKAVIFDMDGVIFDTEPIHEEHAVKYSEEIGAKHTSAAYFQQLRGSDSRTTWSKVIQDHNLPHAVEDIVVDARKSYEDFLRVKTNIKSIRGVKELLQNLKKNNFKLAVATSAGPKRVELLLKIENIKDLFEIVVNADHVMKGKPNPEIFLKAAEMLNINPESCLVIEDSTNGVNAGKAAGMTVIGFAGLPHNKQDLSQADKIIYSFNELTPDIIQSL